MAWYMVFAVLLTLATLAVLGKGLLIMTAERGYWNAVDSTVKVHGGEMRALRGNILSDKGQQLACNLPEYKIKMDFNALRSGKADTLWHDAQGNPTSTLLELCDGLHEIFPNRTSEQFLHHLDSGYNARSQCWYIVKGRIDYSTYQKVKALPIFRLRSGIGGFASEEVMVRNRPYGSLASTVVGGVYKETEKAYAGLELSYDSVLSGKPGYRHRTKVLNGWVNKIDSNAVDGKDIVTTIDVGIQDLAERALVKELREVGAYTGVAIVMEVATGDVKAMVNMDLDTKTGQYVEGRNHAVADWLEPGSVFKVASILVGLDDKKISIGNTVNTGNGVRDMYGAKMRDHNWSRGGYGTIDVPKILQVSSNIGVSVLIDNAYHHNPDKFVEGLHRVGIAENLHLPFSEYMPPKIRMPKKDSRGKYSLSEWTDRNGKKRDGRWSNTALPWMSIGYETNVPPISVLTFYNAIANGGKMMRPRFVQRIEKDGEVLQEFAPDVIKEHICGDEALGQMQDMLYKVVDIGLGKKAGSPFFHVSGKTGTAQKASNGGYKNGVVHYLLSFCGYFPSGKNPDGTPVTPQYSCIVCIQKAGLPASGGGMSGPVFKEIAEGIMANSIKYDATSSRDEESIPVPDVKNGNMTSAEYVLGALGIPVKNYLAGVQQSVAAQWGKATRSNTEVTLSATTVTPMAQMPDVMGMGARDAVYLIESRGGKVTINGCGKVKNQSKPAGEQMKKGERVTLVLG